MKNPTEYVDTITTAPDASGDWAMYLTVRAAAFEAMSVVLAMPEDEVTPWLTQRAAVPFMHARIVTQAVWEKATDADRGRWYRQVLNAGLDLITGPGLPNLMSGAAR